MSNKYCVPILLSLLLSSCPDVTPNLPGTNPQLVLQQGDETFDRNSSFEMGQCLMGEELEQEILIKNTGDSVLKIHSLTLEDEESFSIIQQTAELINPGTSDSFKIRFTPREVGPQSTKLVITHNVSGENGAPYIYTITASSADSSLIELSWDQGIIDTGILVDVGVFNINTPEQNRLVFTLTDTGNHILELKGSPIVSVEPDLGYFITDQPESTIIPGGSSSFAVQFNPGERGLKTAEISIAHNSLLIPNPFVFQLQAHGETLPETPTNLRFLVKEASSYTLSWNDNSINEDSFNLERRAEGFSDFTTIGVLNANLNTFVDTGITPGVKYEYRLDARNTLGKSDYSNILISDEMGVGVPHLIVTYNDVTVESFAEILAGTALVGSDSIIQFELENSGDGIMTLDEISPVSIDNDSDFQILNQPTAIMGAESASTFTFNLHPTSPGNKTGNVTIIHDDPFQSNPFTFTIRYTAETLPASPGEIYIPRRTSEEIMLEWQDNAENENGYIIEAKHENESAFSQLAVLPANTETYTHRGLTEFTYYTYRVKAFNDVGTSAYSPEKETFTLHQGPYPELHNGLSYSPVITHSGELVLGYIHIYNYGDEEFSFRLEEATEWLYFEGNNDYFQGSVPPDDEVDGSDGHGGIKVLIESREFSAGIYSAVITLTTPAGNEYIEILFTYF